MTRLHLRLLAALGALAMVATLSSAQCPPPSWSGVNRLPGTDGNSIAASTLWDPDGAGPAPAVLVVGGSFRYIHDTVASCVASWDGTTWRAVGSGIAGQIDALAVYNGELIAAGKFTLFGSTTYVNIARFNGTSWAALGGGTDNGPNGWAVRALAVYNGELIAGGSFSTAGGIAASKIARWNGSAWQTLGVGMAWAAQPTNASVNALVANGSDLYAGGQFDTAGGVVVNSIARWDGTSWQAIGQGLLAGGNPAVAYALAIQNGELVVGGGFETANGVPAPNIARWNGTWHAYPAGPDSAVLTLAVYNGQLVIGGIFSPSYFGGSLNRIARFDGTSWQNLGPGIGNPATGGYIDPVSSLAVYGGKLFVMGRYSKIGAVDASGIGRWNGASWETWPGDLYGGNVTSLTEYAGDLVAGGTFSCAGTKSFVARWASGTWQPIGNGFQLLSPPYPTPGVNAVATYNTELIVAGQFSDAGGVPAANIVRWAGSAWLPLGGGVDGAVNAMTVYNGDLVVGGNFANAGGVPAPKIARWNGSAWLPLGSLPGPATSFTIWNGMLVAGVGGLAPGAQAWNGTSWQALGAGPYSVEAVDVYNGDLIATGSFNIGGLIGANAIAKWNGTGWSALGGGLLPSTTGSSTVASSLSLVNYSGELIVGGNFVTAGGVAAKRTAAWNGSTWHALEIGTTGGVNGPGALAVYGGALFAGGDFSTMGYSGSALVARWSSPLALVRASQPGGNGTGVQIENRWLIPGHEYFNIFSTDICVGGPGTGPYGGLCSNNFGSLVQQALLPLGAVPFHYLATGASATFGPYPAPIGLTFDVLCIDSVNVATGNLGCLSAVGRYTVN